MVARVLLLALSFAAVSVASCNFLQKAKPAQAGIATTNYPSVDIERLRSALRSLLVAPGDSTNAFPRQFHSYGVLHTFYRQRGEFPLWTVDLNDTRRMDTLLQVLDRVGEHGLESDRYGMPVVHRLLRHAMDAAASGSIAYDTLAQLELRLSDAAETYGAHVRFGVLDPKKIFTDPYGLPTLPRTRNSDILQAVDLGSYLRSIQPSDARYAALQKALASVRELSKLGPIVPIPFPGKKIEPGASSPLLGAIERRIRFLCQLRISVGRMQPESSFSTRYDSKGYMQYDSLLVKQVADFQRNHGLLDDGVIGDRTFAAFNMPWSEREMRVILTLERVRWLRYPDTGRYVRVNIPEFYLYGIDNGVTSLRMKVCTGMRWRQLRIKGQPPINYQTPIVAGQISYMVLNPTWSVPPSIAVRETYFEAIKDSTWLQRHNYKVLMKDNQTVVPSASIKWKSYNPDKLPFRFIQDAGEGNALGRIKFIFDNPFDIYLHDTPKRAPFKYATRSVSHGCVRIEEPMRMVDFLQRGSDKWDRAKIEAYLQGSKVTKTVYLDRKIPVYVDYNTVWVDNHGVIQYRDDVYGKDAEVKKAFLAAK